MLNGFSASVNGWCAYWIDWNESDIKCRGLQKKACCDFESCVCVCVNTQIAHTQWETKKWFIEMTTRMANNTEKPMTKNIITYIEKKLNEKLNDILLLTN